MKDWLVTLGLKKKPRDPNAPRYADLYERSMAAMIDLGLIYVLLNDLIFTRLNRFFFGKIDPIKFMEMHSVTNTKQALSVFIDSHAAYWWVINTTVQALIIMLMITAAWMLYGTTPGKWLLGIRIVRRDLTRDVARWRYALRMVMIFPASIVAGIGIFWMVFNKERRGWHDMVAGTVVIHIRPEWWYWHQFKRGVLYVWRQAKKARASSENVQK